LRLGSWLAWATVSACARSSIQPIDEGGSVRTLDASAESAQVEASAARSPVPDGEAPKAVARREAGASTCRLLGGPVQLSRRGAAALATRGDEVLAVLNEDGRPALASFRVGPLAAGAGPPPAPPTSRAIHVPCAVTGDIAFCPDRAGGVHRSRLAGTDSQWVASSFAGTHVSAVSAAGLGAVLLYLARRQTSEGWVTEAWVLAEQGLPVRLSEDGSGATSSAFRARGSSLLAVTVDSRVALTAMHAREIRYDHGLRLGEDVVIFVGGPGDPGSAAALALFSSSAGWALLPIARDISAFGMALVKLDDPPRVDEPVLWSMYLDGLDPAPVATALTGGRIWVARVAPEQVGPGAPQDLELGELTSDGVFALKQVVSRAEGASEVALVPDSRGALWVAWLDRSGSWMQRLSCP
jgi:hypothetical protein